MQTHKEFSTKPHMKELHLWIVGLIIMEIWKTIPNCKGYYQVSDLGVIKSFHNGERVLKQNGIGRNRKYKSVSLKTNNGWKCRQVHRLVAMAFIPNPENKEQINHKDGDPSNNHIDNLEWCDAFENMQHAVKMGLMNNHFGETHANSKFTDVIVKDILKRLGHGEKQHEIAKEYNVNQSIVSDINTGKSWRHIPRL